MSLSTLTIGSSPAELKTPTAVVSADPAFGVLGSVVKLDGRGSTDPDGLDLTYTWEFLSVPIGSRVASEGFRTLDEDGSVVSFSPDIVGEYVVGLTVSNGLFESSRTSSSVSIRAILVPHGRGLVPDGKFIWSYVRDVWTQVEGREFFETLWSALIQISGSELLKLYQVDFHKSIRDIQDQFQRRWLPYEPKLVVDGDVSFYLGTECAGTNASTQRLGLEGEVIILSSTEVMVVSGTVLATALGEDFEIRFSRNSSNVQEYVVDNTNASKTGYKLKTAIPDPTADKAMTGVDFIFSSGSTVWQIASGAFDYALAMSISGSPIDQVTPVLLGPSGGSVTDILVGDVIYYRTGPNAGIYKVLANDGTYITVDRAPQSFSDGTSGHLADVYHPVGYTLSQPDVAAQDTFVIPYEEGSNDASRLTAGRVIVVGGRTYTILRTSVDRNQVQPLTIITLDGGEIPTGFKSLNWRAPHTLVSDTQNFEEEGVSPGDLFVADVTMDGIATSVEVVAQVVGVDRNRIGFELTDEPITAGVIPEIPNKTYIALSSGLQISTVSTNQDGTLSFSDFASEIIEAIESRGFERTYFNTELTPDSGLEAAGFTFKLSPRYIIRNRRIPVDETLRSVPMLQEYIVQPTIAERSGKLFTVNKLGTETEISRRPINLFENSDYLVDGEYALSGELSFKTDTDLIEADDADFVDRGILPGDSFVIETPSSMSGSYTIQSVLSNNQMRLSRPIPLYVLSEMVRAKVRVERRQEGHFLRFVPGLFTAKNPAPSRLWGEVSFFDNNDAIESNFGILVGLTRDDLASVSSDLNYRQAVAGIMYALTRGSAVDKVRLGAHILLGLPFAEHRGIIKSIEPDYRLDINGDPIQGRILVEDVDSSGASKGTLRVYIYPIEDSDLAGLEINPETGEEYAVGDTVEIFAPLCKGVQVDDYLTTPLDASSTVSRYLQQFHSIRVKANDNIFSLSELGLLSDFLKKITPSYVAYHVTSSTEVFDEPEVEDDLSNRISFGSLGIVDNASLNIPPALLFDSRNPSGIRQIRWDDGVYWVRHSGSDMSTISGSAVATSAAGGILTPASGEGPVSKAGDKLLIVGGLNAGLYSISSVSDTTATVSDAPAAGFNTLSDQRFAILRPVSGEIRRGTATVTSGDPVITTSSGLRADGVAPGDIVTIGDLSAGVLYRGTVIAVENTGSAYDKLRITPTPSFASGTYSYRVWRDSLIESPYMGETIDITSDGTSVTGITGDPHLILVSDIMDEFQVQDATKLRSLILDPFEVKFTPMFPAGTYTVRLCKRGHAAKSIGWNHIDKFDRMDPVEVGLVESTANASISAGGVVTFATIANPATAGFRPGDIFQATSGANSSVDVGYGAGLYPITRVDSTSIYLDRSMTVSTASWKIVRRR